jgi:hypothetical protein
MLLGSAVGGSKLQAARGSRLLGSVGAGSARVAARIRWQGPARVSGCWVQVARVCGGWVQAAQTSGGWVQADQLLTSGGGSMLIG